MQETTAAAIKGIGNNNPTATPQQPTPQIALSELGLPQPPAAPTKGTWDITQLRLPQDYSSGDAESVQATIPVHRPSGQAYFRAHPEWNFPVAMLEYEDCLYPVNKQLHEALEADLKVRIIIPCITRDGDVFLWPIAPLQATGRGNEWVTSAHRALAAARRGWIRVRSNMRLRSYDVIRPKTTWDEPTWPELTFEQMLETAFADSFISTLDHPVIRALQGEL